MKLPSEPELIEIENRAEAIATGITEIERRIRKLDETFDGAPWTLERDRQRLERLREDIRLLVSIARDPNRFHVYRTMDRIEPLPRTSTPEPAPSARPNHKKAQK